MQINIQDTLGNWRITRRIRFGRGVASPPTSIEVKLMGHEVGWPTSGLSTRTNPASSSSYSLRSIIK